MSDPQEKRLQQRAAHWQEVAALLPQLEDGKPISEEVLKETLQHYPELARDLAVARRHAPTSRVTRHLEALYAGLHRALFRAPAATYRDAQKLFGEEIPAVVHELRWQILSVSLGFVLTALAGWWLVSTYPELAALFASEAMIRTVQSGELWTDNLLNVMPSSVLSVQILTNNIMVALTAMSLGVLYGLGTIYIIGLNGLMLGGVFAFTAQHDMAQRLLEFVFAHGCVELSVIAVAGAVGFSIGEALARPGQLTRTQAFQRAVQRGSKLMLLCVIFLFGAGIIEGYISPDPRFDFTVRVAVGIAYWVVFVLALGGWRLFRRSPAEA